MAKFHPIVLMTDFGTKDAYVASMKGVILRIFPSVTVIDLTHEIEPQNVKQGAFVLEAASPYFPLGSIFVSVVDPGVGSERRILAAKTRQGIFLAPDNGLLTRVLEKEKGFELRVVTHRHFFLEEISPTFHGRDCFAPTAASLAKNPSQFYKLGPRISNFKRFPFPSPRREGRRVIGEVIYFDHFGNAFTNISKGSVSAARKGKPEVRVKGKKIGPICQSYFEAPPREAVAVFSSTNLLEIAVSHGSAKKRLGLREGARVELF